METSRSYRRARQLLRDRFGNDFVVAETWVNKVAGGPVIGWRDKTQFVDTCLITEPPTAEMTVDPSNSGIGEPSCAFLADLSNGGLWFRCTACGI